MKRRDKGLLRKWIAGFGVMSLLISSAGCGVVVVQEPEPQKQGEASLSDMEPAGGTASAEADGVPRPQDDFYGYVNKEYLDLLDLSREDGMGIGGMARMSSIVDEELYRMIAQIAESDRPYGPGSNEQLVRDVYRQLLVYLEGGTHSGKEHFAEVAGRIKAAENTEELRQVIRALVKEEGITAYFDAEVARNYYDGRSYALTLFQKREFAGYEMKELCAKDEVRKSLRGFALNALIASGEDVKQAGEKADALVRFVTEVSCNTDYSLENARNPYLALDFSTNGETDAILLNLTSGELSEMYDLENPYGGWVIEDERQSSFMAESFREENLEVLKSWLLCEVLYGWANYLRSDFVFLEAYTDQAAPADVLASMGTVQLLERQVGELYAQYYYTEEMEEQLQRMYADIKASYRELIGQADWLTEKTRERLLRKLENMTFVCGSAKAHEPDPRDEALIGGDIFETMRRIFVRRAEENRERIGSRIDRQDLDLGSYVVNAKYDLNNTFMVCAAMMHAPYFDAGADYAENLGGIGIVMGHEMGHAFDSMCIDYDENGVYDPEGICTEDREKLESRLKQMEDYYSSFSVMEIYYVDGEKTSGENYADKGAMECVMNIVKTPQDREKVFVSYARVFGMLTEDDQAVAALDEDVHSPGEVRVNAVLASTEEFYELYDLKPGDGMYVPPQNRVSRYR